jgi:hypothetical protein
MVLERAIYLTDAEDHLVVVVRRVNIICMTIVQLLGWVT